MTLHQEMGILADGTERENGLLYASWYGDSREYQPRHYHALLGSILVRLLREDDKAQTVSRQFFYPRETAAKYIAALCGVVERQPFESFWHGASPFCCSTRRYHNRELQAPALNSADLLRRIVSLKSKIWYRREFLKFYSIFLPPAHRIATPMRNWPEAFVLSRLRPPFSRCGEISMIRILVCLALLSTSLALDANGNPARRNSQIKSDDLRVLLQQFANNSRSSSLGS